MTFNRRLANNFCLLLNGSKPVQSTLCHVDLRTHGSANGTDDNCMLSVFFSPICFFALQIIKRRMVYRYFGN